MHPNPLSTLKRNWALSEEQRREEFPPSSSSYLPSPNPVPHSLRSIVKTQPPLFPWPGLLKQRALHEKKRLAFKCCAVKGGLFQVGAEIWSDSRVLLLFSEDEALLEPGSVRIHRPPASFSNLPQVRSTGNEGAKWGKRYSSKHVWRGENVWLCVSFRY